MDSKIIVINDTFVLFLDLNITVGFHFAELSCFKLFRDISVFDSIYRFKKGPGYFRMTLPIERNNGFKHAKEMGIVNIADFLYTCPEFLNNLEYKTISQWIIYNMDKL